MGAFAIFLGSSRDGCHAQRSCLAEDLSLVFLTCGVPKKHKNKEGRLYREFLEAAPGSEALAQGFEQMRGVLFCLKDVRGRYLYANTAFLKRARIAGQDQLVGKTSQQLFPELLAAGYERQDATVLSGRGDIRDRLEMITNADGSLGWYLSDKVPVRGGTGKVVGLASVSRDLHLPAADDPRIGEFAKALKRMRREYSESLRITQLAEECGMSLSKFERLMRSILHVSPRQLLTRIRVEAAAEKLKFNRQSIGEIALECGFCDQPTFSKQFKAVTGMTAGEYRRLVVRSH